VCGERERERKREVKIEHLSSSENKFYFKKMNANSKVFIKYL
jgi:hypothetical protein